MKPPRPLDDGKLAPDRIDALADGAPVGFDLGLAWAAKKAETAPLALKVRPGSDEAAFLIGKPRQFDLQPALLAARPVGEDFQNQPRPIENLRVPGLLEITLLDRAQQVVDDRNRNILSLDDRGEFLDLPGTEKRCGPGIGYGTVPETNVKTDRFRKTRLRRDAPNWSDLAELAFHETADGPHFWTGTMTAPSWCYPRFGRYRRPPVRCAEICSLLSFLNEANCLRFDQHQGTK